MHVPVIAALAATLALGGCASSRAPATAAPARASAQTRLTAEHLEQLMERIGPSYTSLQKNLEGNMTAEAGRDAEQLAEWFGGVEKFWSQHNRDDAMKWAQQARIYATDTASAAATGDAAKATAAAGNLGAACKQCHGTYREPDGQGGYRIKPGALTR